MTYAPHNLKAQADGSSAPKMTRAEAARHASLVRWKKEQPLAKPATSAAIQARVKQILAEKAKKKGPKAAKPKGGKGKAAKPKDARTPQEKANQNRAAVAKQGGMSDLEGTLVRLNAGMQGAGMENDKHDALIKKGLAERGADGKVTLSAAGKKWMRASGKGDAEGASAALAEGADHVGKQAEKGKAKLAKDMERTGKQAAAAQVKQAKQAAAKEKVKAKAKAAVARAKAKPAPKPATPAKPASSSGGGGGGGGGGASRAPAASREDNRAKVAQDMADQDTGLAPGGAAALNDFADGKPLDKQAARSLTAMGLVETDDQGAPRLTAEGRAAAQAMSKGDTRATLDAISRAGEKKRKTGKAIDMDALKAGARHSRTDQQHIQGIHDSAVACGAECGMDGGAMDGAAEDAMKSMMDDPGYYAQHECGDIMQAASALSLLCSLTMSELAEEDDDPADIGQLVNASRILVKYISDELDELEEYANQDAEEDQAEGETDNVPQPMTMKAIGKREDVSAADKQRAVAEYGDVTYADEKNKKYPLDTEAHIRAANSYIGQEKNQAMYSAAEVETIKKKIAAAWRKVIDPAGPPSAGKTIEAVYGSAIKALEGDTIGGYAVLFGTADTPDMSLQRDFFTKSTDFWLDRFGWPRPMTYHHGLDPETRDDPIIGTWTKATVDDVGVWLEGQLDKAHRYHMAVKELVRRGYLKLSSDSAPQWVIRAPVGDANEVKRWPFITASPTVAPAEPRLAGLSFKALLADLGLEGIDDSPEAPPEDATRPDAVKVANDERARRLLLELSILDMETST